MTDTPFLAVILRFLAPILAVEPAVARQAIAAYHPASGDQCLTIAQIVAFALTGMDTLRLSMPEDLPAAMKQRLRGTANALTRTAQRATNTLAEQRHQDARTTEDQPIEAALAEQPTGAEPAATPKTPAPAIPVPRTGQSWAGQPQTGESWTGQPQTGQSWAGAMTEVADEFTAELPSLDPAARRAQSRKIDALHATVRSLQNAAAPLKSRLLGTASFLPNTRPAS